MSLFKVFIALLFCSIVTSSHADIRVGTAFFYPPFIMSGGTGFDEQLIQKICKNLHEKCLVIPMNLNKIFTCINKGSIDIGIGGLTFNAQGDKKHLYSLPYILSKGQFIVQKRSGIDSIEQLKDLKVGVISDSRDGSVFYKYILSTYPGQFKVIKYNDMDGMISSLSSNYLSAVFTHESTGLYWELNGGNQFKLIGSPEIVGEGISIIGSVKNPQLMERINQELLKLQSERFYSHLYSTYFANEQ